MLRETGSQFGTGCGGASVAAVLAPQSAVAPLKPEERLSHPWAPILCVLSERKILLQSAETFPDAGSVAVPVRVGKEACRLHLSTALMNWLQQALRLEGSLVDEEPLQRALLLELASLDLLRLLESELGEDIRFGEGSDADLPFSVDLAVVSDERPLALRIDLSSGLARKMAHALDQLQPPKPADHAGLVAEIAIEAGSQELTIDELESLEPGDIVMLASFRPAIVVGGRLIAAVRRQSDGFELDGAFSPRAGRAMAGSLSELQGDQKSRGEHILHVAFEMGRTTMTLGEIDALKPGLRLPLAQLEETAVDIVVGNRRIGRGELTSIGAGLGVRVVHLLPAASAGNCQTS